MLELAVDSVRLRVLGEGFMKRSMTLVAVLLCGAFTTPALAQSADDLAAKFGALEAVSQISLSPDGSKVAWISPRPGGGQVLLVANITEGGEAKAALVEPGGAETLSFCRWPTNDRLLCLIRGAVDDGTGRLVGFSRMFALNADGSNRVMLTRNASDRALNVLQYAGLVIDWNVPGGIAGHVLMNRDFEPKTDIGTLINKSDEGLGVEDVDVVSLKRNLVERPKRDAREYIANGRGDVRIMGRQGLNGSDRLTNLISYSYRKAGSRDWLPLSEVRVVAQGRSAGFNPYAVDPAKDLAYGFDQKDGRLALYSMALDGSGTRTLLLARPDVDVDSLVQIGRDRRVVGASYATEKRTIAFFDPQLKSLSAALQKALPGNPAVDIVDSSADESKLLLLASSDVDPGKFYLFDKATRHLAEVLPVRPPLAGVAMGTMKPVAFPAGDGTQIPGYLTLPAGSSGRNLPAIVMPHGGPSSRDVWGFDWLVQYYASHGYAVLQPNYRGSSGFGADFYQKNGFQSWRTAIGDVDDAGRWLIKQGIADPKKLAIVGWSYGGYAALLSGVLDPGLYKAIVAVAPVTDLEHLRQESVGFTNFKLVSDFIGQGLHVREGSPAQNASRITVPVLLFHGDKDQNVNVEESRFMADRLKDAGKSVTLVQFPGLDHQLSDSQARSRLLSESDAFLRKAFER